MVTFLYRFSQLEKSDPVPEQPEIPEVDEPENIADLLEYLYGNLEELIKQSAKLVGKPVALMNKEDKVKAIRFLNDSGAFLITKSGQRVCNFFGISKYTLYSYIDEAKGDKE